MRARIAASVSSSAPARAARAAREEVGSGQQCVRGGLGGDAQRVGVGLRALGGGLQALAVDDDEAARGALLALDAGVRGGRAGGSGAPCRPARSSPSTSRSTRPSAACSSGAPSSSRAVKPSSSRQRSAAGCSAVRALGPEHVADAPQRLGLVFGGVGAGPRRGAPARRPAQPPLRARRGRARARLPPTWGGPRACARAARASPRGSRSPARGPRRRRGRAGRAGRRPCRRARGTRRRPARRRRSARRRGRRPRSRARAR